MSKKRRLTTNFVFPRVDSRKTSEVLAETIAKAVYLFDVAIGEKLPSEVELSRQFGVSRTVLREALRLLVADGIVRIEPGAGGGAFIIKRPIEMPMTGLGSLFVNDSKMVDVLIARRAIEPQIVQMAASRATHEDLDTMRKIVGPLEILTDKEILADQDVETLSVAALRFNIALGRATHVPFLATIMETLTQWMEPVRRSAIRQAPEAAVRTLEETLEAVEKNDPSLMERILEVRFDLLERAWENDSGRRLWRELPSFIPR